MESLQSKWQEMAVGQAAEKFAQPLINWKVNCTIK